jgi:DNA polymerase (family 10)
MTPLDATQVAKLLAEYGRRTALAGGNPYRSKAYMRAADSLAALAEPLERIVAEDRLREIPGIGAAIADIVTKLHRTGTHPSLERMRREIPEGVLEMLSVPGLRPDKVLKLHQQLGIANLAELERAAGQDRIKNAKGLGPALQRKIVQVLLLLGEIAVLRMQRNENEPSNDKRRDTGRAASAARFSTFRNLWSTSQLSAEVLASLGRCQAR